MTLRVTEIWNFGALECVWTVFVCVWIVFVCVWLLFGRVWLVFGCVGTSLVVRVFCYKWPRRKHKQTLLF